MSKKKLEPTRLRLARDLAAVNEPALNEVIERASAGYYSDFDSPLATPQGQLMADLQDVVQFKRMQGSGDPTRMKMLEGLLEAVEGGEYEGTEAESKRWMEREGTAILRDGFGSKGKNQIGAADSTNVTYLTRRLIQVWTSLLGDQNVRYSRMDMMMAIHNAHVWAVLDMMEGEEDAGFREQFLKAVQDTFERRMGKERGEEMTR